MDEPPAHSKKLAKGQETVDVDREDGQLYVVAKVYCDPAFASTVV